MSTKARKIVLSAALLCALAPAATAGTALAAGSGTSTGAASAPGGAEGASGSGASQNRQASDGSQEGVALATWFGPGLFGNHTACGQVLTKRLIGVANRTLPCGTLVKVSYGKHQLTVPVVDRGPYGRLHAGWDLTQAAARLLDIGGVAKVDTTIVGRIQNSPELGQPRGHSASSAAKPAQTASAGATGGTAA